MLADLGIAVIHIENRVSSGDGQALERGRNYVIL